MNKFNLDDTVCYIHYDHVKAKYVIRYVYKIVSVKNILTKRYKYTDNEDGERLNLYDLSLITGDFGLEESIVEDVPEYVIYYNDDYELAKKKAKILNE